MPSPSQPRCCSYEKSMTGTVPYNITIKGSQGSSSPCRKCDPENTASTLNILMDPYYYSVGYPYQDFLSGSGQLKRFPDDQVLFLSSSCPRLVLTSLQLSYQL